MFTCHPWLFKDQFICVQLSYDFSEVNVKKPLTCHSFHASHLTDDTGEPAGLSGVPIGKKPVWQAPGAFTHGDDMI